VKPFPSVSGSTGSTHAAWQRAKYIIWAIGIVVLSILGAVAPVNNSGRSGELSVSNKPVIHGTVAKKHSPKSITKQSDNGAPPQRGKIAAPAPAKSVELQPFYKRALPSVRTTLPLLSKSIVTEALPRNSSKPLSGIAGTVAGVAANIASSRRLPTTESLLPTLPLSLADGALQGSISPGSTALQYHDSHTRGSFGLGAGYIKPQNGSSQSGAHFDAATMLFRNVAVGSAVTLYNNRKDIVASTVWQIPCSRLRVKASGGYLSGNQNFDFQSGTATIDMRQYSYLFSAQYIAPKAGSATTLHSAGFSLWGSQLHQQSTAPRSYRVESSSDYIEMNDPLKLSEGRLMGASADAQVAVRSNMVVKGSLGYEQLRFPFADGTRDFSRSAYYNADLTYEPVRQIALGAGYKAGAGENRITLSVQSAGLQLNAFKTKGQNGVADDKGFTLSWHASLPDAKQRTSLASRMQPSCRSDASTMLAEALTRPSQLPKAFLAKVDKTAVFMDKANIATLSTLTPGTVTIWADGTSTQILTVTVKDIYGKQVTSGGAEVVIKQTRGTGGTGTISSVTDHGNGTYTAAVTAPTTSGSGVFVATLAGYFVKGGTHAPTEVTVYYSPAKLAVTTQPAGAVNGLPFTTQPKVQIQDADGKALALSGIVVTVSKAAGSGTATLSGTLTATTDATGLADFSTKGLTLTGNTAGIYTLTFTADASHSWITPATSSPFPLEGPYSISIVSGDHQQAPWGTALSTTGVGLKLVVLVKDFNGNPVADGTKVTFGSPAATGGSAGSVFGDGVVTTTNGLASLPAASWTLGTIDNTAEKTPNTLTATVVNPATGTASTITFTALATPLPGDEKANGHDYFTDIAGGEGVVGYVLVGQDDRDPAYDPSKKEPGYLAETVKGLIVAKKDQSTDIVNWATEAYKDTLCGAYGSVIGTGKANTAAIIAKYGSGTDFAAGAARAYGDSVSWFLPSYDELQKLSHNIDYINRAPGVNDLDKYYWSSTEDHLVEGYVQGVSFTSVGGGNFDSPKYNLEIDIYVRAVRYF
jgi:Invasin, domain 3